MAVYEALGGARGLYKWAVSDDANRGTFYKMYASAMVPRMVEGRIDHTHRALPPAERDAKLAALLGLDHTQVIEPIEVRSLPTPPTHAPISTGGGGGSVNGTHQPTDAHTEGNVEGVGVAEGTHAGDFSPAPPGVPVAPNGWWDRKKWGPEGERRVTEGEMAKAIRLARDEEREFQMERRKGTSMERPIRLLEVGSGVVTSDSGDDPVSWKVPENTGEYPGLSLTKTVEGE